MGIDFIPVLVALDLTRVQRIEVDGGSIVRVRLLLGVKLILTLLHAVFEFLLLRNFRSRSSAKRGNETTGA